jgi:hypothetical protein
MFDVIVNNNSAARGCPGIFLFPPTSSVDGEKGK